MVKIAFRFQVKNASILFKLNQNALIEYTSYSAASLEQII
jgi:hypothetical protein